MCVCVCVCVEALWSAFTDSTMGVSVQVVFSQCVRLCGQTDVCVCVCVCVCVSERERERERESEREGKVWF